MPISTARPIPKAFEDHWLWNSKQRTSLASGQDSTEEGHAQIAETKRGTESKNRIRDSYHYHYQRLSLHGALNNGLHVSRSNDPASVFE